MFEVLVSGLSTGSIYALLALALVLVLKATDIPNFAQADFGLVAAFILWAVMDAAGVHYFVAIPVALAGAFLLGVLVERFAIRPILSEPHFATVLMTIGISTAIHAVAVLIWGTSNYTISSPFSGSFRFGGAVISYNAVVAVVMGVVITIGLLLMFRTQWGARMQAVAENPSVARLLGVNFGRVVSITWGLAAAIAGVALILNTQSTTLVETAASVLILKGFVAATIGGFTSVVGAFIGGLSLGVIESFAGAYISTASMSAVALLVIVVLLIFKPEGLFGRRRIREV